MAIPSNKQELISAIKSTYNQLCDELLSVPSEVTEIADLVSHKKGTQMSVNNLLAYLIGWGELVLKWEQKKRSEEEVIFPEEGYKWNELGLLAQKFYIDYEKDDFERLKKKLSQLVEDILQLIEKTDEETLYHKPFYGKYSLGRMIQLNTSSPYKNARSRIRKWKKAKINKL